MLADVDAVYGHAQHSGGKVLLVPGFQGNACLSNVEVPRLAGNTVNTWCFEGCVVFDNSEETGDYHLQVTFCLKVVFR